MNDFWKRNWWKYLLFVATLVTYGNLYGSWWSVIPGVIIAYWWIELSKKPDRHEYNYIIKNVFADAIREVRADREG